MHIARGKTEEVRSRVKLESDLDHAKSYIHFILDLYFRSLLISNPLRLPQQL